MPPSHNDNRPAIERLNTIDPATRAELEELLEDSVRSGASVGFVDPLDRAENRAYWDDVAAAVGRGRKIILVARQQARVVGSVQLELATKANALHRAEVQKLMVHTSARRHGIGRALMTATEAQARELGRTLLVLDTRGGDAADQLYRTMNYTLLGLVPGYAKSSSGVHHATAFFYKHL